MDKKFLVAGTSTLKGNVVTRFANGTAKARTKVLVKNGDTDIVLVDLSKSLTKVEALAEIREKHASLFNADQLAALEAAVSGTKTTKTKSEKVLRTKAAKTVKKAVAKTVKAVKTDAEKAAVKAVNLETIKAAAKAMQKRTRKAKVVDTTEGEVATVDADDADYLDGLRSDLIPTERGARLAEEV